MCVEVQGWVTEEQMRRRTGKTDGQREEMERMRNREIA